MKHEKLSKRILYKYTNLLYSFLLNNPKKIKLKKLRAMHGTYDYGTSEIQLDYRRELIPTVVHEVLHHYHPEMTETEVLKLEKKLLNQLSIRQIKNIIKKLSKVV